MSDLTEAHRRTFQSLAKAINSLHKRKWIDDEKREHYRRILKAMAADEENYNQDTVDRLRKKLDRVKKKMTAATSGSNDESKSTSTSTEKIKSKMSSNKAANANIRQPVRNTESSKTNEAERLDVTKGKRQTKRDQDQGGVPGDHTILSLIKQETASESESLASSRSIDDRPQHSKSAESSTSGRPPVPRENTKSGDRDRSTPRRVLTRSNESTHPLPIPSTPVLDVKNHHSNLMRRERKSVAYPTPNQPRKSASPVVENTFVETRSTRNHDLSPKEQNKLHPTSTRTVSPMKPQHRNHHDPIAIIDPKEIQTFISHESLKVLFVEMCVFGRMGFVQPPSCIRCILAKKNKHLPNEFDNRQCKNLVVWRRNANTGEEYKFHPDKLDGNILIVTCAAAQSWFMGEIVDGKKWDGERKVVYEVKGQ